MKTEQKKQTVITFEFEEIMAVITPLFCEKVFGTEDVDIHSADVKFEDGRLILTIPDYQVHGT